MNEVIMREKLKNFSRAVGLNPNNFTLLNKPAWFSALVEAHKARKRAIPGELVGLIRKYAQMDSELDEAIQAIEQEKEADRATDVEKGGTGGNSGTSEPAQEV